MPAGWCCASLSAIPAGVVSHYQLCLLVWCLTGKNILLEGLNWFHSANLKPFLINMRKKFNCKVDGWIKLLKKRENIIYLWSAVYQHKTILIRDMHAEDVRYHLDCWLGVSVKYRSAG